MAENAYLDDLESFGTPERALRETMRRDKPAVAGSGIEKLKSLLKSMYENSADDLGMSPEPLGLGGMVSMARPGSAAWPKLRKMFSGLLDDYPKIKLQRFQQEPAGKEVYRRGGEYYLGLGKPADDLSSPLYRKSSAAPARDLGEGGHLLKLRELEAENPAFVLTPGHNKSFLQHFMGQDEVRKLSSEIYTAQELQKEALEDIPDDMAKWVRSLEKPTSPVEFLKSGIFGRSGAKPEEIKRALEAREVRDSLYDLFKTKFLEREGIDAVVRKRKLNSPEVFVTDPKSPKLQPLMNDDLRDILRRLGLWSADF